MHTLTIPNKGTDLFTFVYPAEHKETVILLHGGPGIPDPFRKVIEILNPHFQVLCFHQRGTGLSPCQEQDYSMSAYLSDISCIASYFQLPKFHLFGHSWGGLYAQLYAEHCPSHLSSLFLCSPSSGMGQHWVKMEKEILRFNISASTLWELPHLALHAFLGMLGSDNAYQRLGRIVLKNYLMAHPISVEDCPLLENIRARAINKTLQHIRASPPIKRVNNPLFPVSVTYGDADIYGTSTEHVRQRYPTGIFHQIEDSRHFPWLQNPKMFQKILLGHFKGDG